MDIRILFFGATADAAGSRVVGINIGDATTVGGVVESLNERYPRLSGLRLLTAVNETYAETDTILKDGDQIAVFTAVSGG